MVEARFAITIIGCKQSIMSSHRVIPRCENKSARLWMEHNEVDDNLWGWKQVNSPRDC